MQLQGEYGHFVQFPSIEYVLFNYSGVPNRLEVRINVYKVGTLTRFTRQKGNVVGGIFCLFGGKKCRREKLLKK